jgi:hypothetical protein
MKDQIDSTTKVKYTSMFEGTKDDILIKKFIIKLVVVPKLCWSSSPILC